MLERSVGQRAGPLPNACTCRSAQMLSWSCPVSFVFVWVFFSVWKVGVPSWFPPDTHHLRYASSLKSHSTPTTGCQIIKPCSRLNFLAVCDISPIFLYSWYFTVLVTVSRLPLKHMKQELRPSWIATPSLYQIIACYRAANTSPTKTTIQPWLTPKNQTLTVDSCCTSIQMLQILNVLQYSP